MTHQPDHHHHVDIVDEDSLVSRDAIVGTYESPAATWAQGVEMRDENNYLRSVRVEHDDGSISSSRRRMKRRHEPVDYNNTNTNESATRETRPAIDELKAIMFRTSGRECTGGRSSSSRHGSHSEPKIQRVPQVLRAAQSGNNCYDPLMVSIGPYHYNKDKKLQAAEIWKEDTMEHYVRCSLKREVEQVYNDVLDVITEARERYLRDDPPDDGNLTQLERFRRIMFVDGCFLVQFILWTTVKEEKRSMIMAAHKEFLFRDLFLLENQLPFSVIKRLLQLKYGNNDTKINEIIKKFVDMVWESPPDYPDFPWGALIIKELRGKIMEYTAHGPRRPGGEDGDRLPNITRWEICGEPMHLLHVVQMRAITINCNRKEPSNNGQEDQDELKFSYRWRSATELRAAGIKFIRGKSDHLNDIHFKAIRWIGILTMTPMRINATSEPIFMNLVAFEALPRSPADQLVITSHLAFLDSLIDNAADVKVLRSSGIIDNALGSDEQVAQLFNKISRGLSVNHEALFEIYDGIDKHYKDQWKVWINQVLDTHFSSPWTILAFLAALVALFLSAAQTYYTVFPRNSKNKHATN